MKKERSLLSVSFSILVLSVLLFLSACGKEEEPEEETGWFSRLNELVIETVTEKSYVAIMIEEGYIEPVIDKIHYGSFSQESANEIFVDCRLEGMPHAGGLDTRAGILLDADNLKLIAYKEFDGDGVMLHCLQTASGQSRILSLRTSAGTGNRGQFFELWSVSDGEWEELPTGIEEFIPEEKKGDIAVGMDGTERRIEDSFCYLSGENRLVVTYEQDFIEDAVPSELIAILEWSPFQEQFVFDIHAEQPAIQQK